MSFLFFFFNDTATTEIYTLSLHDALPIYAAHADAQDHQGAIARSGLRRYEAACRRVIGYWPGVSRNGCSSRRSSRISSGDRKASTPIVMAAWPALGCAR